MSWYKLHFKPFKFGQAEIIAIAIFAALIVFTIGIATIPGIANWYAMINTQWTGWALRVGYPGAFASAFVGSMSTVIVLPYTIIIFFLATRGLDPFLLGLLMGTGAFLGQMTGYLIGLVGSGTFKRKKPDTYDILEQIVGSRQMFLQFLIFVFGATPLPDDALLIPLGMLRYPFWKIVLPSWVGKCAAGWMVTYFGALFVHALDTQPTNTPISIISQIGSLFTLTATIYLFIKLDWGKMLHKFLGHPVEPSSTQPPII